MTIVFSNTLGTALGGFFADDSGLGFVGAAAVFAGDHRAGDGRLYPAFHAKIEERARPARRKRFFEIGAGRVYGLRHNSQK